MSNKPEEVGIYKRKILRKKRKHAFDQEKSKIQEKKKGTHGLDKENKKVTKEKKKVLKSYFFFFYEFPPQFLGVLLDAFLDP